MDDAETTHKWSRLVTRARRGDWASLYAIRQAVLAGSIPVAPLASREDGAIARAGLWSWVFEASLDSDKADEMEQSYRQLLESFSSLAVHTKITGDSYRQAGNLRNRPGADGEKWFRKDSLERILFALMEQQVVTLQYWQSMPVVTSLCMYTLPEVQSFGAMNHLAVNQLTSFWEKDSKGVYAAAQVKISWIFLPCFY
eukprot:TRINITY_DN3189_c0_g1_i1.p1 TRINITY_DN3189_c0_g1~~TRINITY_DN3189_c0_g1_i1.p1  ORF type:complete len:213 (+),score=21.87 TRINITY_DN3189_c0_g1_i1:48-641(+)